MNRRLSQQILISKLFIEFLHRKRGISFALDLHVFEELLRKTFGSPSIGAVFGFEQIKTSFSVLLKPGLHRGDANLPETIMGEFMFDGGLFPEVLVLGPGGFSKHRADELVAFKGNLFSNLFVHGLFLLGEFFDHHTSMTMKPMINPYPHRPFAKLCTITPQRVVPEWPLAVGQGKGGEFIRQP